MLVGRNVATAFGMTMEFHTWKEIRVGLRGAVGQMQLADIAVVPHPSGRNHWYNDVDNLVESAEFWRDFLG